MEIWWTKDSLGINWHGFHHERRRANSLGHHVGSVALAKCFRCLAQSFFFFCCCCCCCCCCCRRCRRRRRRRRRRHHCRRRHRHHHQQKQQQQQHLMFKTSRNFDHSTTWLLNNKIHVRPILLHRRLWATPWFFGRDWRLCTLQASKGLWQCDNSNSIVSCTGSSFILGDWSLEGPFSWHIWMFSHIQLLSQKSCILIRVGELHSLKPTFCPLKNGGNDHLLILGAKYVGFREGIWFVQSHPHVLFQFFFLFSNCWRIVGDAGLSYGLERRSSFSHLVGSLDCKSLNMFRWFPPSIWICDHSFGMWTTVITRQAKSQNLQLQRQRSSCNN